MEKPQSINQSSTLHLVESENLKKLLGGDPELKQEYDKTMELIDILRKKPNVETLDDLNTYFERINNPESCVEISKKYIKLCQNIRETAQKPTDLQQQNLLEELNTQSNQIKSIESCIKCLKEVQSVQDIETQLFRIKFIYIQSLNNRYRNNIYFLRSKSDLLYPEIDKFLEIIDGTNTYDDYCLLWRNIICEFYNTVFIKYYLSNSFKIYIKSGLYSLELETLVNGFKKFADSKIILALIGNQDQYNFFKQFHKMLNENLTQEDKQLFYDYLNSCREKLQDERNNYRIFNKKVRNLTAIFIFGIIASATVLTINLLEIYAALWFFWFGIVGAILTVAVGIRLFFCLKENWNDLKKLESNLQKGNTTIQQKITDINRAIEVFDLEKIRHFEEPEPEKISMFDLDEKKFKGEIEKNLFEIPNEKNSIINNIDSTI